MRQEESDIRHRLLVARLPAMPQILLKLIEQCQTDEVGMAALAELVSKDPGMTGKILAIANSSAYHRGNRDNRKAGLEQALITLGTEMIKTLVISESVLHVFNNFSHANSTDLRAFWKHSLTSALLARSIAESMRYPHAEEAYLAGLLHDVGRLALLATAPKEYGVNFHAPDDDALCELEEETLRITHQEAGAWLIERWNLDSFLSDSVLYHHESSARLGNVPPLIKIVLLAHLLSDNDPQVPAVKEAATLCGIDEADLEIIAAGALAQVQKSAQCLGIELDGTEPLPSSAPREASCSPVIAVKTQLSDEVRNWVLASEAGRSLSSQREESSLLEAMTRSARILFDFEDTAVLKMDSTSRLLVGIPAGENRQRLGGFSVALSSGGGVAEAALQRRTAIISNDGNPLGIAEEQLLRIVGTDALVCLPLTSRGRCFGVLVGGISAWQIEGFKKREGFLRAFAEQAAISLETVLGRSEETTRRVDAVAERFRHASRKIAHEVNNPLSIIKNYLGILDSKLERQEPVSGEIPILNEEIDRVGSIIREYAEIDLATQDEPAEVNHVIRDVVRLFKDTEYLPDAVKIVACPQELPTEIDIGPDTAKQILINLVKNAIEAMRSGEVRIINNGHVNRDGTLYIEVCVIDDGPGMSPAVLRNLFHPVQTTKGNGHQGLGLNIVHGLVEQNRGRIACRSSSKGTRFEVLLPARDAVVPVV